MKYRPVLSDRQLEVREESVDVGRGARALDSLGAHRRDVMHERAVRLHLADVSSSSRNSRIRHS